MSRDSLMLLFEFGWQHVTKLKVTIVIIVRFVLMYFHFSICHLKHRITVHESYYTSVTCAFRYNSFRGLYSRVRQVGSS